MSFSDRHFTRNYCYLRHPLEKRTREAGNKAETDHVPQETGHLDAGFEKGRYKVHVHAVALVSDRDRGRERKIFFGVYDVNDLPRSVCLSKKQNIDINYH